MFTQLLSHRRTPAHLFTISVPLFYLYYTYSSIKWIPALLTTFQHMPLPLFEVPVWIPSLPSLYLQLAPKPQSPSPAGLGTKPGGPEGLGPLGAPPHSSPVGLGWAQCRDPEFYAFWCLVSLGESKAKICRLSKRQMLVLPFNPSEWMCRFDTLAH